MGIGWILIIGLLVFGVSKMSRRRMEEMHKDGRKNAMERLNERFIEGEIDEETFKSMRNVIRK